MFVEENFSTYCIQDVIAGCLNFKLAFKGKENIVSETSFLFTYAAILLLQGCNLLYVPSQVDLV